MIVAATLLKTLPQAMNSERRHELQQNELAGMFTTNYSRVKPYLVTVGACIVGAVVVWFTYTWLKGRAEAANQTAWQEYQAASAKSTTAPWNALKAFIDSQEDDNPALLAARQEMGDRQRMAAEAAQISSPEEAGKLYQDAIGNYTYVRERTENELLKRKLSLAIARSLESRYDLTAAKKEYGDIVQKWPESSEALVAKERNAALDNKSIAEWYDWHKTARASTLSPTPKAPDSTLKPETDLNTLPPDKQPIEPTPGAGKPATDKPATDKPATDKPATDKPATDKPATDTPVTDKPAEDKPAADKPATDKPGDAPQEPPKPDDKPASDKPDADKSATDKPADPKPEDKPAADKPAEEPKTLEPPKA